MTYEARAELKLVLVMPCKKEEDVTICHKFVTSWKENVLKLNMNPES